jgi:hypothetical protein
MPTNTDIETTCKGMFAKYLEGLSYMEPDFQRIMLLDLADHLHACNQTALQLVAREAGMAR